MLSKREKTILTWIACGYSYKSIAAALNIHYKTVTIHMKNIRKKLACTNAQAEEYAIRTGLLDPRNLKPPYPAPP